MKYHTPSAATAANEQRSRQVEADYFYAIRIKTVGCPAFLARGNASAPNLFWFHEDAVAYLAEIRKSKPSCDCRKCILERCDIVKVFVRWTINGPTYNTAGDMFRSAEELTIGIPPSARIRGPNDKGHR